MKLLTLSDGYGDSDATPVWYPKYWKWPKIIELMTKSLDVTNCSRYGAGNEFIVNQLKQEIDSADIVIVQWAQPDRLDLVLDHNNPTFWNSVIANDPVYNKNIVLSGPDQFWISSGSKIAAVQEYHQKYITKRQHQLRSQVFIEYAKLLLENRNIDYRFMLVENSSYLNVEANWICHEPFKGMNDFRYKSKYQDLEIGIVQPIPLVAFDFIKQYVMPSIDLHWRNNKEIDAVENMLYRHYQESVENKKQYDSN
jgi:hypothetical protein